MINWRRFQKVSDTALIREVESKYNVVLPNEYILIVKNYDGGVPDKKVFIAGGKERVFQRFISIQKNKHPNLLDTAEWLDSDKTIIPFAMDPFGNYICFEFADKNVNNITYTETETNTTYVVCSSFKEFLDGLH